MLPKVGLVVVLVPSLSRQGKAPCADFGAEHENWQSGELEGT
jgi:hypothetical protein